MRPRPPDEILNPLCFDPLFIPSHELDEWARATFIDDRAKLLNPDHEHLRLASIGWLWTNWPNSKGMLPVVGQAEFGRPPTTLANRWAKARWEFQVRQWFGKTPDFIITLFAPYAADAEDVSFCALTEHELFHCAQVHDEFDCPKFRKNGMPVFGIRGHDVEEFVGIVRRYGADAGAGRTKEFVAAARRKPEIGRARIAGACGTCRLKLA